MKPADSYLFSADARPERTMGRSVVRGKQWLYSSSILLYHGFSLDEMAGRLIRVVRDRLTAHAHQYVQLSGAGVELDGGALVLASPPNEHLGLLAALLVRGGGRYLGDEVLQVDPILHRVHPLPLPLLVDSDDITLVPKLGRGPVQKMRFTDPEGALSNRRPVTPQELGGDQSDPAPVRWIVFPTFEPGARSQLLPMPRAEALFRLAGDAVLNLDVWRERATFLARDLLAEASVARLVVGSPEDAVHLLTNSLDALSVGVVA
jgi:hypothetical protein